MKAHARVETEKASRYLQALCGHFSRKVEAKYTSTEAHVDFSGRATAELRAQPTVLWLEVSAADEENLESFKGVVADHLERFAEKDDLKVSWQEGAVPPEAQHVQAQDA